MLSRIAALHSGYARCHYFAINCNVSDKQLTAILAEALALELQMADPEKQAVIWNFYKPRHTHTWNMLVLSWRALDAFEDDKSEVFQDEYLWESFIIRLWLYRTTIKTLTQLHVVSAEAKDALEQFDRCFKIDGKNGLKAVRDMIEHFDDYAAGRGRGPATRDGELDPWRTVTRDRFERGRFVIERASAYEAAIRLRSDARQISDTFIAWYESS